MFFACDLHAFDSFSFGESSSFTGHQKLEESMSVNGFELILHGNSSDLDNRQ